MIFKYPVLYILLISAVFFSGCISQSNKKEIPPPPPPPDITKILFCGDVMLDWGIKDTIEKEGVEYSLRNLKEFLGTFSYRFCNLETPVTDKGEMHPDKKYIFRGVPEHIALLKYAGINGVSLANNHTLDMGETGLLNTIKILTDNNISTSGAGINLEAARLPIKLNFNNCRVAILAYANAAYTDYFAGKNTPGVAAAEIDIIAHDIKRYRPDFDFIIISIHWGNEYSEYPAEKEIRLGHQMIDCGADAIIGHHPHIFQGIEIYKGKPIFYSLGNFLFGSVNEDAEENILVQMSFDSNQMTSFSVYPINGNGNSKTHFLYRIIQGDHARNTLEHLVEISKPINTHFPDAAVINEFSIEYSFKESGKE